MTSLNKELLSCAFILCLSGEAIASSPEQLFKDKWSEICNDGFEVETSEYVGFSESERCDYFVDTFRVQSHCEPATFKALKNNRLQMTLNGKDTYIIEFLWSSRISVMEVVTKKPLVLKQTQSLGRAIFRKNLLTHYLYCP